MILNTRKIFLGWLIMFVTLTISCNDLYKAGNSIPLLGIQIESNINENVAFKYIDTANFEYFQLPEIYNDNLKKGGDLEYFPASNKIFYFKDSPEEAYHLSSNSLFFLEQVFNPAIGGSNWIYQKSKFNVEDIQRIEKRIRIIITKIVSLERKSGIPDSMIFFQKPYDSILCRIKTEQ